MASDELLDAEAEVAACRRAGARAEILHAQLAAEQETCHGLRRRLDAERADVQKMTGSSVSSVLARLRGRRDELLVTERAELAAVEAELATHQSALRRLSLQFEAAREEASTLPRAEARLAAALEQREREIAAAGGNRSEQLRALDHELADGLAVLDDLRGAHSAALGAVGALERAIEALSVAHGWSTFDTFADRGRSSGSGWVAGRAKHEQLDRTVEPIAEAHAALIALRATLTDASASSVHRPNVRTPSTGLAAMDVWFDNLFSDLMVHDRITSSLTELRTALASVTELIDELAPRERAASDLVRHLEGRRDALLRR